MSIYMILSMLLMSLKSRMNQSFLFLYRVTAIFVLYGVLLGVGGYLFMQGFYVLNHGWIAPLIVSPSNDLILSMTSQLISSKQMLTNLKLDRDRLRESLETMRQQRKELVSIDNALTEALTRKGHDDVTAGGDLKNLIEEKRQDITKTNAVLNEVAVVEDRIQKDLRAGLITKGDAATQRTALTQFTNAYTDNRVAEVMLRDSVRQKTTTDVDTLEILSKKADLKGEIVTLEININVGVQQLVTDQQQIAGVLKAMNQVEHSPFYIATQAENKIKFAFVPYDNEENIKVGAPVYDCYLDMIACRHVGAIKTIFSDEQKASHPVFKTDMRGFLIELALTRPESAKSKTLFVGCKPMLF